MTPRWHSSQNSMATSELSCMGSEKCFSLRRLARNPYRKRAATPAHQVVALDLESRRSLFLPFPVPLPTSGVHISIRFHRMEFTI